MLGAIIGDTIGSVYEFNPTKKTDFQLFTTESEFTDDSVMSMAVADWLLNDSSHSQEALERYMVEWGNRYPDPMGSYGGGFGNWLFSGNRHPYYSWGNGSAMRCSACGWVGKTLADAIDLATRSAIVTHNHPEGIRGAQATAAVIWMARHDYSKQDIKDFMSVEMGYDMNRTCDDIRPRYDFKPSCQETVPESVIAFLDSHDYESAIRLTVSLGGDADTMGSITGGIAEAFYKKIPDEFVAHMHKILPEDWWGIINCVRAMDL